MRSRKCSTRSNRRLAPFPQDGIILLRCLQNYTIQMFAYTFAELHISSANVYLELFSLLKTFLIGTILLKFFIQRACGSAARHEKMRRPNTRHAPRSARKCASRSGSGLSGNALPATLCFSAVPRGRRRWPLWVHNTICPGLRNVSVVLLLLRPLLLLPLLLPDGSDRRSVGQSAPTRRVGTF